MWRNKNVILSPKVTEFEKRKSTPSKIERHNIKDKLIYNLFFSDFNKIVQDKLFMYKSMKINLPWNPNKTGNIAGGEILFPDDDK